MSESIYYGLIIYGGLLLIYLIPISVIYAYIRYFVKFVKKYKEDRNTVITNKGYWIFSILQIISPLIIIPMIFGIIGFLGIVAPHSELSGISYFVLTGLVYVGIVLASIIPFNLISNIIFQIIQLNYLEKINQKITYWRYILFLVSLGVSFYMIYYVTNIDW